VSGGLCGGPRTRLHMAPSSLWTLGSYDNDPYTSCKEKPEQVYLGIILLICNLQQCIIEEHWIFNINVDF
jgi:hypothetical protein